MPLLSYISQYNSIRIHSSYPNRSDSINFKVGRATAALILAFLPVFGISDVAKANCVNSGQEAAVAAAQQAETTSPVVVELNTCGGDDMSYQIPLAVEVTFDGQTYSTIYVTTNSVITFGRPDGTYWTYPSTPSISLYSMDWVVYPGWRSDEHLVINSSDGGFQVDISARPIWQQNATEPTNIIITAAILSDGTVAMAYSVDGPTYDGQTRTGVRLNDGSIVSFETYGIQQVSESPTLSAVPTTESPFIPEPTESPTVSPEPTESPTASPEPTQSPTVSPEPPFLNSPTNVRVRQLPEGNVEILWDAPQQSNAQVERYAISWQNSNGGWGVASTETNIYLSREMFAMTGGLDSTYSFTVRSDNDTIPVYSQPSSPESIFVSSPAPEPSVSPTVSPEPTGSPVVDPNRIVLIVNEGNVLSYVAPEGYIISGIESASYGADNGCHAVDSLIIVEAAATTNSLVISADNGVFGDPCGGTYKRLSVVLNIEQDMNEASPSTESTTSIPVVPTPEPTSEPVQPQPVEPSPEPSPEPSIEPTPVEPTPTPTPEPKPSPTTTPEPTPVDPVVPKPTETPLPLPTPATGPETPKPSPTANPEPKPTLTPTPTPSKEPEPIVPEKPVAVEIKEPITAENITAVVQELATIQPQLLTQEQQTMIVEAALQTFETALAGSEEYVAALEALLVVAQADDIVLDEELAAIPLIGNVAGAAVEVLNALGNAGADMSPQVREQSEKVVIAAVIVGQVAMTATAAATSAAAAAARRP
jgi:hypothetical protein